MAMNNIEAKWRMKYADVDDLQELTAMTDCETYHQ